MIKLHDIVYGDFSFSNSAIEEIIESKSFQKLKKISQFGVPDEYWMEKNYSRYEHSIGVMILLRILDATVEEQIAGLLHDISHTSFSHIYDWVFGHGSDGNESDQDSSHINFVMHSEIPQILEANQISVSQILNYKNFPLLENDSPDICADRIDYCLRELAHKKESGKISIILDGIFAKNGTIYFKNTSSALLFSNAFLEMQNKHWGSQEGVARYYYFSKAIKIAVDKKLINREDFWGKSEQEIKAILVANKNDEITNLLTKLKIGDFSTKSGKKIYKKFRFVDPLVKYNSSLARLTSLDKQYKTDLERSKATNALGFTV